MSVSDNNMSGRGNDPEQIDLIDLLMQLWRGKVTIVVAIVVAIVLAVGYLVNGMSLLAMTVGGFIAGITVALVAGWVSFLRRLVASCACSLVRPKAVMT